MRELVVLKYTDIPLEDLGKTGVYTITNKVNHKFYVGSATQVNKSIYYSGFYDRFKTHIRELNDNTHHCSYLQRSWNKYGAENFEFKIIHFAPPEDCIPLEQLYLNFLCPHYNGSPTAGNNRGVKYSEESKRRMSEAQKGKKLTPEQIANCRIASRKPFHVVSPEGVLYEGIDLKTFGKAFGLNQSALAQVNIGNLFQHKGWTATLDNHKLYVEKHKLRGISRYTKENAWQVSYRVGYKKSKTVRFKELDAAIEHRDSVEASGYIFKVKIADKLWKKVGITNET